MGDVGAGKVWIHSRRCVGENADPRQKSRVGGIDPIDYATVPQSGILFGKPIQRNTAPQNGMDRTYGERGEGAGY